MTLTPTRCQRHTTMPVKTSPLSPPPSTYLHHTDSLKRITFKSLQILDHSPTRHIFVPRDIPSWPTWLTKARALWFTVAAPSYRMTLSSSSLSFRRSSLYASTATPTLNRWFVVCYSFLRRPGVLPPSQHPAPNLRLTRRPAHSWFTRCSAATQAYTWRLAATLDFIGTLPYRSTFGVSPTSKPTFSVESRRHLRLWGPATILHLSPAQPCIALCPL